jgi:hypothetical protein
LASVTQALGKVGAFGRGAWRYWRLGEPSPESNVFVQKLYAFTDGRSNDILFRILESKRKESDLSFSWDGGALESHAGIHDGSVDRLARTLKDEGVVVVPTRLKAEAFRSLLELATSCPLTTTTYGPPASDATGTHSELPVAQSASSNGMDPSQPAVRCMWFLESYC